MLERASLGRGCRSQACTCCSPAHDSEHRRRQASPGILTLMSSLECLKGQSGSCAAKHVSSASLAAHRHTRLALAVLCEKAADGHARRLELVQKAAGVAFHAEAAQPVPAHSLRKTQGELRSRQAFTPHAPSDSFCARWRAWREAAPPAAPRFARGRAQSQTQTRPSLWIARRWEGGAAVSVPRRPCACERVTRGRCSRRRARGATLEARALRKGDPIIALATRLLTCAVGRA